MRSTQLQEAQARDVQLLFRGVPFGQYQYIDITFPATANESIRVRHELKNSPLSNLGYVVVRASTAATIYDGDLSVWDQTHFSVRSTIANTEATLLVFTRR